MELNTTISKAAMEVAQKSTDFVLEQLIDIVEWQLSDSKLDGDNFELAKSLAIKSIIENIYKRL